MSEHITLKDVETAIKILEEYLKHVQRARSVLQRYQSISGHTYKRAEDIVAEIIAKDLASRAIIPGTQARREEEREEEKEEEIDIDIEKAVERLRQLAESEKKKIEDKKQSS